MNLKKHLLCFGETQKSNLSVYSLYVLSSVYIFVCMFVQTRFLFNPSIMRNVLCMLSERVENLCGMVLIFSSRGDSCAVIQCDFLDCCQVVLKCIEFQLFELENLF